MLQFTLDRLDRIVAALCENRRDRAFEEVGLIATLFRHRQAAETCFAAAYNALVPDSASALMIGSDRFHAAYRGGGLGLGTNPLSLSRLRDPEILAKARESVASWFGPPPSGERIEVEGSRYCSWREFADLLPQFATVIHPTLCVEQDGFFEQPPPSRGAPLQRLRLVQAAETCAAASAGDLVEIGANLGETTVLLAGIARRYARRVIVVDPWQPGGAGHCDADYAAFKSYTRSAEDVLDVIRASSLEDRVRVALKERELCFALVDGLHTYDACLSDLIAVAHTRGLVAVDDVLWKSELSAALVQAGTLTGRTPLHYPLFREAYLVPRDHGTVNDR